MGVIESSEDFRPCGLGSQYSTILLISIGLEREVTEHCYHTKLNMSKFSKRYDLNARAVAG